MAIGQVNTKITNITGGTFTKYKGYFLTLDSLKANHPTGEPGDYAFIQDYTQMAVWNNQLANWTFEKTITKEVLRAIVESNSPTSVNKFATFKELGRKDNTPVSGQYYGTISGKKLFSVNTEIWEAATGGAEPETVNVYFTDAETNSNLVGLTHRFIVQQRGTGRPRVKSLTFQMNNGGITVAWSNLTAQTGNIPQGDGERFVVDILLDAIEPSNGIISTRISIIPLSGLTANQISRELTATPAIERPSVDLFKESATRVFLTPTELSKLQNLSENYKGYYLSQAALNAAMPVGQAGWWTTLESTDTVWVWDANGAVWTNTGSTAPTIELINVLTDTSTNKALTAAQGKVLKDLLDSLTTVVNALNADAIDETASRVWLTPTQRTKLDDIVETYKGYHLTSFALDTAYPVGQSGWWATVESTDTVWLWDTGTNDWVDSGTAAPSTEIINVLTDTSTNKALSAAQGKALKDLHDTLQTQVNNLNAGNIAETATRVFITPALKTKLQNLSETYRGYFLDATALQTGIPAGSAGWWATVESTDTVWIWDANGLSWVNSGTSAPSVEVINVLTDVSTNKALSAAQGKALKDLHDTLQTQVNNLTAASIAETAARVFVTPAQKTNIDRFKGYHLTSAALIAAYPAAANGDYAIVKAGRILYVWVDTAWQSTLAMDLSFDETTNLVTLTGNGITIDTQSLTATGSGAITPPVISEVTPYKLVDTATLAALPVAGISDYEIRLIAVNKALYYFDPDATTGDVTPDDQVGGIGFWLKITNATPGTITGGVSEDPSATWSWANDIATVTMAGNLDITGIAAGMPTGYSEKSFVHGGSALTITLPGLATQSGFTARDGEYRVIVQNKGTQEAPVYRIIDGWKAYGTVAGSGALATEPLAILSTDVLQLFTTPKQLQAAPGANKFDLPIKVAGYLSFQGTPYTTNLTLQLLSGSTVVGECLCLGATANMPFVFDLEGFGFPEINQPLTIKAKTGNPVAGNGNLGIIAYYERVDLSVFTFPAFDFITLGTTAQLQGSVSTTTRLRGDCLVPEGDGEMLSISIWHDTPAGNILVGVYSDSALTPTSLLASSAVEDCSTTGYEKTTHALITPLAVTKGTKYWIGWVYSAATNQGYLASGYGTTALKTTSGFALANPFGAFGSPTLEYPVHANMKYNPATYNYLVNENFTQFSGGIPVGWGIYGVTNATNYVEQDANGLHFYSDGTQVFGIELPGVFTNGQPAFIELEIYSKVTGVIYVQTESTPKALWGTVGKNATLIPSATGTGLRLYRHASLSNMILRGIKAW